jgi:hypothetical protein
VSRGVCVPPDSESVFYTRRDIILCTHMALIVHGSSQEWTLPYSYNCLVQAVARHGRSPLFNILSPKQPTSPQACSGASRSDCHFLGGYYYLMAYVLNQISVVETRLTFLRVSPLRLAPKSLGIAVSPLLSPQTYPLRLSMFSQHTCRLFTARDTRIRVRVETVGDVMRCTGRATVAILEI